MNNLSSESVQSSKKPKDSSFRQQSLPAWQPVLTAGTVLPSFFFLGLAFIPIGIAMLWFSENVMELRYDYTYCNDTNNEPCHKIIQSDADSVCSCIIDLPSLTKDWEGPVFIYYGLTNFFQNHRRYVKSRDDNQLLGRLSDFPNTNCAPFDVNPVSKLPYLPCGAIANSLFSDEIKLMYRNHEVSPSFIEVPVLRTGIAWESDKSYKFANPPVPSGMTLKQVFQNFSKPRDWHRNLWELDLEDENNNGLQNEDLIVWMRVAALPNFRKFYRRINHAENGPFSLGLPANFDYRLHINYRFNVTQFAGTKSFILSTTSVLGGKNSFLGISYIVVGSICMVMGVIFLFVHIKYGKLTNKMLDIDSQTPFH